MSQKYRIIEDERTGEDTVDFVVAKDNFTEFMKKIMEAYCSSKSDKFRVSITGRLYKGDDA